MNISSNHYKIGDRVIYRKSKKSDAPSPNAIELFAEPAGESYRYTIKKYWSVIQVDGDRVQVVTRRGKRHWLSRKDPFLRRANIFEKWFREEKFPKIDSKSMEDQKVFEKEQGELQNEKRSEEKSINKAAGN